MGYYADEIIKIKGKSYTPATDVIHESEGLYTNVVKDYRGKKYEAYYTQEHYENDDWASPIKVVPK